jgi:large subunit ribosomal protein L24e
MESKKCSFCGTLIELGTGKMLVKKDGSIFYFCSHKCEKNMRLGRIPRRMTWIKKERKTPQKK